MRIREWSSDVCASDLPYRVTRYNLFPAVEVDDETAPGASTGQAIEVMEKVAESLPAGFSAEWTDIAFQQKAAGNIAALIFALSVVFVFLVLARSEEHTSELQSLMRISYAVFCLKKT